ncbi:MAG: biotin synthase [Helicobacter sp.]|nr:biotin synthase [Helicobacter sp.]
MREIFLCSISNVSSGNCPEDCSYCTQSIHYKAKVATYNFKPLSRILEEARILRGFGVLGFCLVTSGRGISAPRSTKSNEASNIPDQLDSQKCEFIAKAAFELKKEHPNMHLIACCGCAKKDALAYLKASGIDSYNHNLESAKSFFPNICSTHSWEERFETCQNVNEVGLSLCSGGIFGLGESYEQRLEFLSDLAKLKPKSVPINFFINNIALPIHEKRLSKQEAIECVLLARDFLSHSKLMIAGGREAIFGGDEGLLFDCGIDAIVLGDYLTTPGFNPRSDLDRIMSYGVTIAKTASQYGLNISENCD